MANPQTEATSRASNSSLAKAFWIHTLGIHRAHRRENQCEMWSGRLDSKGARRPEHQRLFALHRLSVMDDPT